MSVSNHGIYLQLFQQAYCQDQEVQSHTFEMLEKKNEHKHVLNTGKLHLMMLPLLWKQRAKT